MPRRARGRLSGGVGTSAREDLVGANGNESEWIVVEYLSDSGGSMRMNVGSGPVLLIGG